MCWYPQSSKGYIRYCPQPRQAQDFHFQNLNQKLDFCPLEIHGISVPYCCLIVVLLKPMQNFRLQASDSQRSI